MVLGLAFVFFQSFLGLVLFLFRLFISLIVCTCISLVLGFSSVLSFLLGLLVDLLHTRVAAVSTFVDSSVKFLLFFKKLC